MVDRVVVKLVAKRKKGALHEQAAIARSPDPTRSPRFGAQQATRVVQSLKE